VLQLNESQEKMANEAGNKYTEKTIRRQKVQTKECKM
jgi:hypothetical protein